MIRCLPATPLSVAVIVASPADAEVTTPELLTRATPVASLAQLAVLDTSSVVPFDKYLHGHSAYRGPTLRLHRGRMRTNAAQWH